VAQSEKQSWAAKSLQKQNEKRRQKTIHIDNVEISQHSQKQKGGKLSKENMKKTTIIRSKKREKVKITFRQWGPPGGALAERNLKREYGEKLWFHQ